MSLKVSTQLERRDKQFQRYWQWPTSLKKNQSCVNVIRVHMSVRVLCVYMYMCVRECACVCVCARVCEWSACEVSMLIHNYTYMCAWVCKRYMFKFALVPIMSVNCVDPHFVDITYTYCRYTCCRLTCCGHTCCRCTYCWYTCCRYTFCRYNL